MMYAVIETGGKQYRVEPGDVFDIELTGVGSSEGDQQEVVFERVLLVGSDEGVQVGVPVVEGARVTAALLDASARGPKIKVFKKKRRKGYKRTQGHRQHLHRVRVADIAVG